MAPSKPLGLGMIGLSAKASTSWASGAHLPALLSEPGKERYKITALCNSSLEAAEASIKTYELDASSVRAYGSPEDLAADPNVQVVSCNTRVDSHFKTVLPSIKAGKDVYLEWPIASNRKDVAEVVAAARASGSRVAIGLQGRWAPPVLKVAEILKSGRVGRVLSSDVRAYGGLRHRMRTTKGLQYFTDKQIGGNQIVIGFGHLIDEVQSVVGELDMAATHALLQIQRPHREIFDGPEGKTIDTVTSDVPDLISVHGTLEKSSVTAPGASLIASLRVGQPFPGQPQLQWTINCERGEIRLVSTDGVFLGADAYDKPPTIHVHDFATDAIDEIPWSWGSDQEKLPIRARSVQRCLFALSDGDESGYVGLEEAARRAEQIFGWLDQKVEVST